MKDFALDRRHLISPAPLASPIYALVGDARAVETVSDRRLCRRPSTSPRRPTRMYTYKAAATGLDAAMPPWVQSGGIEQWIARLKDPAIRARVAAEMREPHPQGWESYYAGAGPEQTLLLAFKTPALKPLTGKTLAEVARMRGKSPEETAMDLIVEDGSRVAVACVLMNEANVRRQIALPWMSFGSDESAPAPEGVFLLSHVHPRAYGNFARLLGHYVRERMGTPPIALGRPVMTVFVVELSPGIGASG
jgi:N-acyl-D-amino-acid deacylase